MEVSGSVTPRLLYPLWKAVSTNCIGNWVGARVGLDVSEKRKVSLPHRDQKSEWCSLHLSDCNDLPACSGWGGVYFSGEINGCTSILREASSARLTSVLRMTVKHGEFSGGTSNIYFYCATVKTVESSLAIISFWDYNYVPRYVFWECVGTVVPGRWKMRKITLMPVMLVSFVRKCLN